MGKMPTVEEYLRHMEKMNSSRDETYRYLNFDQLTQYQSAQDEDKIIKKFAGHNV
jgi:aconitate hydratase 2/2-methylisocitrate dehydratase